MPDYPDDIQTFIDLMSRLPGLGPRSGRKAVLHLIKKRDVLLNPLIEIMTRVANTIRECRRCGNIATEKICSICSNDARENGQICVVENIACLWAVERSGFFKGRYHVLGRLLSALDDVGPEDLRINQLEDRLGNEDVKEVILALGVTVNGKTTADYVAEKIESRVRVTSLARGVPMGGELNYLDDGTISVAFNERKSI